MASESTALFNTLGLPYSVPFRAYNADEALFNPVYTLPLLQLWAICPLFVGGDRFLVIKQLREVMQGCKYEYWRTNKSQWKHGLISTLLVLVNILLDMQEFEQVARCLEAILVEQKTIETVTYATLFYLDMGDVEKATAISQQMPLPEGKVRLASLKKLLQLGRGAWKEVTDENYASTQEDSFILRNNAAVTCLYSGKIAQVR